MRIQIYEQRLTRLGLITSHSSGKEPTLHVDQTRESGGNRAYNKMGDPVQRGQQIYKALCSHETSNTLLNLSTGVGGHP